MVFGLTYALESVEFPLYALRSTLGPWAGLPRRGAVGGGGSRPGATAGQHSCPERALHAQYRRRLGAPNQAGSGNGHNRRFAELGSFAGSAPELAQRLRQLRRERGNEWFAAIRGVIAPAVSVWQAKCC